VMHEEQGEGEGAREIAQRSEDGGHFGGVVFILCDFRAYSGQSVHPFRRKPSTHSGRSRPPVPVHVVHNRSEATLGGLRAR
jgi:hypothetical protein